MIQLKNDSLTFSFPEVHDDAKMSIEFQRTLRIPDDDKVHALPPGLGRFPLKHVDDYAAKVSAKWREHGGVMLPMFQSEAMWLNFTSPEGYPFLVKVATGKINAVTGEDWTDGIHRNPQDYMVVPTQPWMDGYCVKKGEIRQFVAMPLGKGYTAEEQITGEAEHGGIQIFVYPMKAEEWEKIKEPEFHAYMIGSSKSSDVMFSIDDSVGMGLAPGGRMKQKIHDDTYGMDVWDLRHGSRCFTHIANSLNWRAITGETPPTIPPTAAQYSKAGLPWFDHYSDVGAVEGAEKLGGLKTVKDLSAEQGEMILPENEAATPEQVIVIKGAGKDVVREGEF